MKNGNLSPLYVPADVSFVFGGNRYAAGVQLVNSSGTIGFQWKDFDPLGAIARPVRAFFDLKISTPIKLQAEGFLYCEVSERDRLLGIGVNPGQKLIEAIDAITDREGVPPPYARKFPRIPFSRELRMMPSRVLLRPLDSDEEIIICPDLLNLSPSGLQVSGDDPRMASFVPGSTVIVELLPRYNYMEPIPFACIVRRIIRTFDPVAHSPLFVLGLSLESISETEKASFTILLREIVAAVMARNDKNVAAAAAVAAATVAAKK